MFAILALKLAMAAVAAGGAQHSQHVAPVSNDWNPPITVSIAQPIVVTVPAVITNVEPITVSTDPERTAEVIADHPSAILVTVTAADGSIIDCATVAWDSPSWDRCYVPDFTG